MVSKFVKQNKLVLAILCIGFIPMILSGYSYYLLILLFPLVFKIKPIKADLANIVLLVLFGLSYSFPMWLRGEPISSVTLFYVLLPTIVYAAARHMCRHNFNENWVISLVLTLAICLAAWAIYTAIDDTITTGQLINVRRRIELDNGYSRGATGYGMMLAPAIAGIGLLFARANNNGQRLFKLIAIVVSLIAIFCTIHLVNRTGLVLTMLSLITCLMFDTFKNKRYFRAILIATAICVVLLYMFNSMEFLQEAADSYSERDSGAGSVATGAGRTELMAEAIQHITKSPFGTTQFNNYAHNLWLDTGLKSGILPLIFLIIITFRFCVSVWKSQKCTLISSFSKMYIASMSIVILAQSFVEPIIEGQFQFFLFYIFLWGMIRGVINQSNLK